jgi:hypothetical protein
MRGIGAGIAESTMLAIDRCTSYDPQNTSRTTSGTITGTIEMSTSTIEATITVMDMTTIDTTTNHARGQTASEIIGT